MMFYTFVFAEKDNYNKYILLCMSNVEKTSSDSENFVISEDSDSLIALLLTLFVSGIAAFISFMIPSNALILHLLIILAAYNIIKLKLKFFGLLKYESTKSNFFRFMFVLIAWFFFKTIILNSILYVINY